MKRMSLCRSALYTPGSQPGVLLKAARSAADVLIFDLEDAVHPEGKAAARQTVLAALAEPDVAARSVVVRVNALGSPWCEDDVRALASRPPCALLFPKIGSPGDLEHAEGLMGTYGIRQETALWCMIETPSAILQAAALAAHAARRGTRMSTWVLGTNDLVKELHARPTPMREGLLPLMALVVTAARAHGLRILDGVHNDFRDTSGFITTCNQGRAIGFDGRTLIHPTQIAACHDAYSPAAHEVEDARAVVSAFQRPENAGQGVLQVEGRMVERLHADLARQTLEMHDAILQAQQVSTRA